MGKTLLDVVYKESPFGKIMHMLTDVDLMAELENFHRRKGELEMRVQ